MPTVRPTAPSAADLLTGYRPGTSFFFASPHGTILTDGAYFAVPRSTRAEGLADLPGRVAAVLDLARAAGHDDPVVVGAVPFDHQDQAHLVVPDQVRRAGPLSAAPPVTASEFVDEDPAVPVVTPQPAPEVYAAAVGRAVARLRRGDDLAKVVLARSLRVVTPSPVDISTLLRRLAGRDCRSYSFATDLGAGRTLLGASPELLVARRGDTVIASPLAGSTPRCADPSEDTRRAEALLASAKDRHEHAVVVDAVAASLRPLCAELTVPAEPSLVRTATMWHLSTVVEGKVADPSISALALATALHPTPAVCGSPTDAARAAIAEYEAFDRGFYTGMVGWSDATGDGEWVVTIRCGVAEGRALTLYAGAGVVADSDPAAELAETSAKFRTLLDALGL